MEKTTTLELDSLTPFQQKLHLPSSEEDELFSPFHHQNELSIFYSKVLSKCTFSIESKNIIYNVDKKNDYLFDNKIHVFLPQVKIKKSFIEKFRISYPENLGISIFEEGVFMVGDIEYGGKLTRQILDFYFQTFCQDRKKFNHDVCNNAKYQTWNTTLPKAKSVLTYPFFYALHTNFSFPLLFSNENVSIKHKILFKKKLSQILRMQCLIDNVWTDIEPNMKVIEGEDIDLPTPELYLWYATLIPDNKDNVKNCSLVNGEKEFLYKEFNMITLSKKYKYGDNPKINIKNEFPCLGYGWMAENEDSARFNNTSNYTTDTKGPKTEISYNPMTDNTMEYAGDNFKFKDCPSELLQNFFGVFSHVNGYNSYFNCIDPISPDMDSGITYGLDGKAKLTFKLENCNESEIINTDDDEDIDLDNLSKLVLRKKDGKDSPNFTIHFIMLLTKSYKVKKVGDSYEFNK